LSGGNRIGFNPRPSREGRPQKFQGARPLRGFNPRPDREGRRPLVNFCSRPLCFNPRPSREGRRDVGRAIELCDQFQSTPLARGATRSDSASPCRETVSIHAPRARGDIRQLLWAVRGHRFNPRPSREGRPGRDTLGAIPKGFNPRPSREGRPLASIKHVKHTKFQSTPLARGATSTETRSAARRQFQSTPLARGATGTL